MDTLYKLHATCGAQYRGSIAVLECNGHSLKKVKPADISEQTESIRAKGTRGLNCNWDKMVGSGQLPQQL